MGYCPWGRRELDTTERLTLSLSYYKERSNLLVITVSSGSKKFNLKTCQQSVSALHFFFKLSCV